MVWVVISYEGVRVMQGLEMDRRTLMQASGVAGAGALGLGAVTADPDDDHFVVASDAHLGSPFSNPSDFEEFLTVDVPAIDPDVLVIAGDCFEMWFRGMSSALLEYSDVASYFETLQETGTDVALVAGNHDRRLVTIGEGLDDPPGSPWEIGEEFFFQSGGQEFVAVHGDGPDPIQIDPVSEALCTQTDFIGSILASLIDWWEALEPWGQVGETDSVVVTDRSRTVSLGAAYDDPVVLTAGQSGDRPVQASVGSSLRSETDSLELRVGPDTEVQYAVFESGRHVLGTGTSLEAGRTTTGNGWQTVSFTEPFDTPPVVLVDSQSRGLRAGRRGRVRSRRYRTGGAPQIRNVTELGFDVRLDGPGTVGFAAVEPGRITAGGRRGVAGVGATEEVRARSFGRAVADTASVLTTPQTASADGPLGYLALTGEGPLHASESSTVVTADAEELLQSEWQQRLDAADVEPTAALPDRPPGMAGLEPAAADDESVKDKLLDKYDEFVVFGHTHMPGLGDRYANSGSWTSRSPDSVPENTFLEIQSGDVTVWDWSSGENDPLYES
jgi:predicted phosphodiesterase